MGRIMKKTTIMILFIIALLFFARNYSFSQENSIQKNSTLNVDKESSEKNNIFPLKIITAFELDGAPLITMGAESDFLKRISLIVDIGIPTGQLFHSPWASRYRITGAYNIYQINSWILMGGTGISDYALKSAYWSGNSVHIIQEIYVGYQKERWGIGLNLGVEPHLSTYVKFSDEYKEMNPSVKEGWYGTWIRGLYYAGISGCFNATQRLLLFLNIAYTWPIEKSLSPFERTILDGKIALGAGYQIW